MNGYLPQLHLVGEPCDDTTTAHRLSRIAKLIASGTAASKSALTAHTGWARSSVSAYVDLLLRGGVLTRTGQTLPVRGRPAELLAVAQRKGVILIADMGARHAHLGVADLRLELLGHRFVALDVRSQSAGETLQLLGDALLELKAGVAAATPSANCVIGLPARLDLSTGVPVRPPVLPGWDGYPVATEFAGIVGCRCITENDVNLRALGEAAALGPADRPLLALKIGTGIGTGLIDSHGHIYYGHDGSAGDVGHIQIPSSPPIRCACGNVGCLEVTASVPGVLRRIREAAPELVPMDTSADLIRYSALGDPVVQQMIREAGEAVGEAIALICNILNPRRVVISGTLARISDEVLAAIRVAAYRMARPLATRHVSITRSVLGELGGVAGAMLVGLDDLLSPEQLLEFPSVTPGRSAQLRQGRSC